MWILIALSFWLTQISAETETSTTDYTGFWKNNCEDPYGIQIMHYKDGLYTTRFCGPGGGCNLSPDTSRLTPIEGDPSYEVVSATEIKEKAGDTVYGILYKCTIDTNPVLKYSDADVAESRRNAFFVIFAHIVYFFATIFSYRFMLKRFLVGTGYRMRIKKSIAIAILFSPGIAWAWPFAVPTFALWALIFAFLPAFVTYPEYSYIPLALSAGPMFACGVIVFLFLL